MNVPKWRVLENHIGNDNVFRVQEFNEIWSSKLKSSLPPHVPPHISLAINCPILAWKKKNCVRDDLATPKKINKLVWLKPTSDNHIMNSIPMNKAHISPSRALPPSSIGWQRSN